MDVAFGANGQFVFKSGVQDGITCLNGEMGRDPVEGVRKVCYTKLACPSFARGLYGTAEGRIYVYDGARTRFVSNPASTMRGCLIDWSAIQPAEQRCIDALPKGDDVATPGGRCSLCPRRAGHGGFDTCPRDPDDESSECEYKLSLEVRWTDLLPPLHRGSSTTNRDGCEQRFRDMVCPTRSFDKHGNNGTVSCNTYCGGNSWPGGVGACDVAVRTDTNTRIGCSVTPGLLPNGKELACTCKTYTGTYKGPRPADGYELRFYHSWGGSGDMPGSHIATGLVCPAFPPPTITASSGTYGGSCGTPQGNVTAFLVNAAGAIAGPAQLASTCNGRTDCDYTVRVRDLGDPHPGCVKNYVATWSCSDGRSYTRTLLGEADGSTIRLSCQAFADTRDVLPGKGPNYHTSEAGNGWCSDGPPRDQHAADLKCDGARLCQNEAITELRCSGAIYLPSLCNQVKTCDRWSCQGTAR